MMSAILKTLVLLVFSLLCILVKGSSQEDGNNIFADILHEIRIESTAEPDLVNTLKAEGSNPNNLGNFPYHEVDVMLDGELLNSIGIRVKGASSALASPDKKPLKLDFNRYVQGQKYDGLKKLNLQNGFLDDFLMKDRLAYDLYRRAGLAAPRTSYAEVYINDAFVGLYICAEQVDDTFIKRNFADADGTLIKDGTTAESGEVKFGDATIFENLNADSLFDRTDNDRFFKFLATEVLIGAFDNYALGNNPTVVNNFYIYYQPKRQEFQFIPWDHNLTSFSNEFVFYPPVHEDRWDNPDTKLQYLKTVCELTSYIFDETYLNDFVNLSKDIIETNSQGLTIDDPQVLIDKLTIQRQVISSTMVSEGFTCDNLNYPHGVNDIVINEFVADNDSLGGVEEPGGGTPDWIELFNNSEEDIILDQRYYLSDDQSFLKKWNFREAITIPGKGYQIVWADRDIDEEGVHTNFKIDKEGGSLHMSYEDLTPINQVDYDEQFENKGFALVPNGIGPFLMQDFTFASSNDALTSAAINDLQQIGISLYPVPASDYILIKTQVTSTDLIELEIINNMGAVVKENIKVNPASKDTIDISMLPDGVYFIRLLNTEQIMQSMKFLKISK